MAYIKLILLFDCKLLRKASGDCISIILSSKLFHSLRVLGKKLFWYITVELTEWMKGSVDGADRLETVLARYKMELYGRIMNNFIKLA